jgi:hypothetical protein
MWFVSCPIAVDDTVFRAISAAHRNCLSEKVNIPIAGASIDAIGNDNGIAVVGVVDSGLDVIEIGRGIGIDVDNLSCEGGGSRRQDEYHYKRRDYAICTRTHFVLLEKMFSKC